MSRYGIGEWYGKPFAGLSSNDRRELAETALSGQSIPDCPFRGGACNKKGGVCSLQLYEQDGESIASTAGTPVIVCPNRFEQDAIVLRWLADIVGIGDSDIRVAREVPFMIGSTTGRPAGKIDLVLANHGGELKWFGLEIQAVYFSGPGMEAEFEAIREVPDGPPPYPKSLRRPDWRSSSAKRLMPQLQIKGPTVRRWGTKIAVAVDKPFFDAIGGPSENPSHDLNDGDIIWLVPEIVDGRLTRGHWEVLTLEESSDKLLSAKTISRQDFEDVLKTRLHPLDS